MKVEKESQGCWSYLCCTWSSSKSVIDEREKAPLIRDRSMQATAAVGSSRFQRSPAEQLKVENTTPRGSDAEIGRGGAKIDEKQRAPLIRDRSTHATATVGSSYFQEPPAQQVEVGNATPRGSDAEMGRGTKIDERQSPPLTRDRSVKAVGVAPSKQLKAEGVTPEMSEELLKASAYTAAIAPQNQNDALNQVTGAEARGRAEVKDSGPSVKAAEQASSLRADVAPSAAAEAHSNATRALEERAPTPESQPTTPKQGKERRLKALTPSKGGGSESVVYERMRGEVVEGEDSDDE